MKWKKKKYWLYFGSCLLSKLSYCFNFIFWLHWFAKPTITPPLFSRYFCSCYCCCCCWCGCWSWFMIPKKNKNPSFKYILSHRNTQYYWINVFTDKDIKITVLFWPRCKRLRAVKHTLFPLLIPKIPKTNILLN